MGVTGDQFTSTCIVIDKFDKLPKSEIYEELRKLAIAPTQIERLLTFLEARDFDTIGEMVGRESKGVQELVELFKMCESYGLGQWIQFDPKIVRYFLEGWTRGEGRDEERGEERMERAEGTRKRGEMSVLFLAISHKNNRGLAYYSGIVFEAFAKTGSMTRAICGGGRYQKRKEKGRKKKKNKK